MSRSADKNFVLRRYALALGGVLLATLLRLALDPLLHDDLPFVTFYVALAAVAWFGGLGPSLLCLVLGFVAGDLLFVQPRYEFAVSDVVEAIGYFIVGAAIVSFGHATRRARRQAQLGRDQLAQELTERRAMEDSLRVSEERLGQAVRVAGLGIFDHDHVTDKIQWSSKLRRILGFKPEEEVGLSGWIQCVHPDDRARIAEAIQEAHDPAGSGIYHVEHRVLRRNGSCRWISVRSQTFFQGEGQARHPVRTIGAVLDITGAKAAEEALNEAHQLYESLFQNSPAAILLTTEEEGRYLAVNAAHERLTGYRAEEVLGHTTVELGIWETPEDRVRVHERLKKGGAAHIEEVVFRRKSGELFPALLSIVPVEVSGQRCLISIATDITERKQAQEALRYSEERFRRLAAATFEGIGISEGARFIDVNEQLADMLGYRRDEMIGMPVTSLLLPEDREWVVRNITEGLETTLEQQILRKDGSRVFVEVHGKSFLDSGTRLRFTAFHDITDRKQAEEALRESELRFRRLIEKAPVAISISRGGKTIYINHKYLQLYGFRSVDELVGQSIFDQWAPESREQVWERSQRRSRGEPVPPEYEGTAQREDGSHFPVHLVVDTVELPDGPAYMAFLTDITERKRAQDEVRRSRDELEQRVKERTSELEHRARQLTRLTSALTLTERTERQRLSEWLHEHLQQILVGAKFGLETVLRGAPPGQQAPARRVGNLLDEAIEACRIMTTELSPPILYAAGLGAGLQWLSRWMAEKHGLTVDLEIDPGAEPSREDLRVLLFQSARELLFNVVKHAGVTSAQVELARRDEGHLQLIVRDQGAGFSPPALDSDAAQAMTGGLGLLGIRERLNLLGGTMDIDSAPGQGACITLIIPRGPEPVAARAPAKVGAAGRVPGVQEAAALRAAGHKICILLVDDHAVVREGLSQLLQAEEDMAILGQAADGQEAVDQARLLHPDVILMDSSMPGMDGVEATRIIHAECPDILIIGLSMYVEADRAEAMLSAGASAYLTKSGGSESLIATIRQIVAARANR